MLYSLLARYFPHPLALVLTAVCYACLLLLMLVLADNPGGEFRYIEL